MLSFDTLAGNIISWEQMNQREFVWIWWRMKLEISAPRLFHCATILTLWVDYNILQLFSNLHLNLLIYFDEDEIINQPFVQNKSSLPLKFVWTDFDFMWWFFTFMKTIMASIYYRKVDMKLTAKLYRSVWRNFPNFWVKMIGWLERMWVFHFSFKWTNWESLILNN